MDDDTTARAGHRLEPADITDTRTKVSMEDAHAPAVTPGWKAPG